MPALHAAGAEVAFFHEVDIPAERPALEAAGKLRRFSVAASGPDRALGDLAKWKPDVVYIHGLQDLRTAERLLEIAPSVTFVHTYIGTCISGTKTHLAPSPAACSRQLGPACLALYLPRRCGGRNPVTMLRLYRSQWERQQTLMKQAAVITHSEHMKGELARHGIAASVLPFPISMPAANSSKPVAPEHDILFAGRMEELKGGALLLHALPHIRSLLSRPLRVQFSGDGPERARWQAIAASIEAADAQISIRFPGWSGETQLAADIQRSRLLVVPSVWPEPFGSVGPAAARFGVPAAAFDVGGIPQWLHDGVNGHLASAPPSTAGLADAILKCLRDPVHHAALSRGAREKSAHFTMERHLPELMRVFESVVNGRR